MSDTHTATVAATDFYRAVANAALFASDDATLPLLTTVHLMAGEPGQLLVEATNRYVASREIIDLIDPGEYDSDWVPADIDRHMRAAHGYQPDSTVIAADIAGRHLADHEQGADHEHTVRPVPITSLDLIIQVKGLVKVTKMLKQLEEKCYGNDRPLVLIEYTDGEGHVALTLSQPGQPDQTLRTEVTTDAKYVSIGSLWPDTEAAERETGFTIAQQWIGLFAKVETEEQRKHQGVQFLAPTAPGKLAQVTIGERFRAIVVPLKTA